jgi:hypothetical protein
VIQFDGPLVYQGESGALNEHIADAFGAMVDQWRAGQTVEEADWLVGKEILGEGVTGTALRSLKEHGTAHDDDLLGKDPQPGHMDDFVRTHDDNGGVHINSGIPNRAFYEIAAQLGGHSWEHAGRVIYATLGNPQLRRRAASAASPASTWPSPASSTAATAARPTRSGMGGRRSASPRERGRGRFVSGAGASDRGALSIAFRRSGGLLPGNVLETSLDARELEDEEAARLRALVEAAGIPGLAARSPITAPGADMYQYELVATGEEGTHRIVVSGSAVPAELKPLVELLEHRAQAHRRGAGQG